MAIGGLVVSCHFVNRYGSGAVIIALSAAGGSDMFNSVMDGVVVVLLIKL